MEEVPNSSAIRELKKGLYRKKARKLRKWEARKKTSL